MAEKEYIEREEVLADELTHCLPYSAGKAAGRVVVFAEDIEAIPAADVAPVRHGRWDECDWVKYDGHSECIHYPKAAWRCSNCCNAFKKELLWKDNYCPNCGAKMELGGG